MPARRTPATDAWVQGALGITAGGQHGAAAAPAPGGADTPYAKSRLAWIAARKRIEGDLGKLGSAIAAAYDGHGAADDLGKAFRSKVEAMLETLDHSLADKLDEVNKATDAASHAKRVQEA